MTVTSWYRTPFKNESVGGVPDSKHQYFLAMDVVPVTEANRKKMLELGFVKVLDEGTHLHGELI